MKEAALIEGLQCKDKIVFDFIFNYYYSGLCLFAMHYLNDPDAAEDIVQDFFVSLWIEAPRIKIRTTIKAYFFTSIKNRCLDFLKHEKISNKHKSFVNLTRSNNSVEPDQYYIETELRSMLEKGLEKLAPRCREIFEMSRIQGLTNQEIADKFKLSKRTVELQISNSLKALRIEFAELLPLFLVGWLLK